MEVWRPIPGFEGLYEISSLGNCRRVTVRPKKYRFNKKGYLSVTLSKDGVPFIFSVHRLVLLAFHGQPSDGQQTRHLDGVKTNNCAVNLAWGTVQENIDDKRRHGTMRGAHGGEHHHSAKLKDSEVSCIRILLSQNTPQKKIAEIYSCSQANVSRIKTGKLRLTNARIEVRL